MSRGVRYVALPDVPLDGSAVREAALLRAGLPFLTPAFSDAHWRVWAVHGAPGLALGGAKLIRLDVDGFTLRFPAPGTSEVLVHYSPYWQVLSGSACVSPAANGWTLVTSTAAGTVRVASRWSLTGMIGSAGSCVPDQDRPWSLVAARLPRSGAVRTDVAAGPSAQRHAGGCAGRHRRSTAATSVRHTIASAQKNDRKSMSAPTGGALGRELRIAAKAKSIPAHQMKMPNSNPRRPRRNSTHTVMTDAEMSQKTTTTNSAHAIVESDRETDVDVRPALRHAAGGVERVTGNVRRRRPTTSGTTSLRSAVRAMKPSETVPWSNG